MLGWEGGRVSGMIDEKVYYWKVQKRFSETRSPVCWTKSLNGVQIKSPFYRSEAITQNQPRAKEPQYSNENWSAVSMQNGVQQNLHFLCNSLLSALNAAWKKPSDAQSPTLHGSNMGAIATPHEQNRQTSENNERNHLHLLNTQDWPGGAELFMPPSLAGFLVEAAENMAVWIFCVQARSECVHNNTHSPKCSQNTDGWCYWMHKGGFQ